MDRIRIPQNQQKKPNYPKTNRTTCAACQDKRCQNCIVKMIYDANDEILAKQYNKDWRKRKFDTIFR